MYVFGESVLAFCDAVKLLLAFHKRAESGIFTLVLMECINHCSFRGGGCNLRVRFSKLRKYRPQLGHRLAVSLCDKELTKLLNAWPDTVL